VKEEIVNQTIRARSTRAIRSRLADIIRSATRRAYGTSILRCFPSWSLGYHAIFIRLRYLERWVDRAIDCAI